MAGVDFGDPARDYGVVFLHANGFNAMTYQSILAPLGVRARVAGVDLRGHGRTTLPADPARLTSWNTFRDDVIAFLEKKCPRGTVLAGHSMGATVALLVAGKRPELVRSLLLAEPVILPPARYRSLHMVPGAVGLLSATFPMSRDARKRRARFETLEAADAALRGRGGFKTWREPFLADYLHDGLTPEEDGSGLRLSCAPAWEAACFAAQKHRPWQALRRTRCDVKILRGATGSTVSEPVMRLILQKRPLSVIETVRGTTHFLPMETPYAVRDALSELISRHIEGFSPGEDGPVRRSLSE